MSDVAASFQNAGPPADIEGPGIPSFGLPRPDVHFLKGVLVGGAVGIALWAMVESLI